MTMSMMLAMAVKMKRWQWHHDGINGDIGARSSDGGGSEDDDSDGKWYVKTAT